MEQQTLPGVTRLDHTGHVAPDLDAALAFFIEVLGRTLVSQHGPLSDDGDAMTRIYGVHPRASVRFAFLELHGRRIQLTEWQSPDQRMFDPHACDIGGSHLAIGVSDLQAAMAFLRHQPGVTLLEPSPLGFVSARKPAANGRRSKQRVALGKKPGRTTCLNPVAAARRAAGARDRQRLAAP